MWLYTQVCKFISQRLHGTRAVARWSQVVGITWKLFVILHTSVFGNITFKQVIFWIGMSWDHWPNILHNNEIHKFKDHASDSEDPNMGIEWIYYSIIWSNFTRLFTTCDKLMPLIHDGQVIYQFVSVECQGGLANAKFTLLRGNLMKYIIVGIKYMDNTSF